MTTLFLCTDCGTQMVDYGIDYLCPKCPNFTDPNYIWTDERRLEQMKIKMDLLKPSVDEHDKLYHQFNILDMKIKNKAFEDNKNRLIKETSFEECYYPAMGVEGKEGCATFTSKEQAEALTLALKRYSYYYNYSLVWDGPGKYRVIPDYRYDHDGETIYTATFIK